MAEPRHRRNSRRGPRRAGSVRVGQHPELLGALRLSLAQPREGCRDRLHRGAKRWYGASSSRSLGRKSGTPLSRVRLGLGWPRSVCQNGAQLKRDTAGPRFLSAKRSHSTVSLLRIASFSNLRSTQSKQYCLTRQTVPRKHLDTQLLAATCARPRTLGQVLPTACTPSARTPRPLFSTPSVCRFSRGRGRAASVRRGALQRRKGRGVYKNDPQCARHPPDTTHNKGLVKSHPAFAPRDYLLSRMCR